MPPCRANAHRNDNQPPQPVDPLNDNVSHAKFRVTFQALAQAVTANVQGNHQATVPLQQNSNLAVARIMTS